MDTQMNDKNDCRVVVSISLAESWGPRPRAMVLDEVFSLSPDLYRIQLPADCWPLPPPFQHLGCHVPLGDTVVSQLLQASRLKLSPQSWN